MAGSQRRGTSADWAYVHLAVRVLVHVTRDSPPPGRDRSGAVAENEPMKPPAGGRPAGRAGGRASHGCGSAAEPDLVKILHRGAGAG